MLALLCIAAVTADLPPYAIHQIAASDLRAVAADARPYTRYASMHGIPEAERESFHEAFDLAANGVSIRGDLYRSKVVGGGLLLRIDLRGWGWDRFTREVEIENLAKLGVALNFKSDRDKQFYIDEWEFAGYFEPFFVVSDGHRRGWLNPAVVDAVEKVAHTRKLVVAAHWLYPRLMLERDDDGFYSQFLLLPPTEKDLEKRLGVNAAFIAVDLRATHGAAVPKSLSVAYNNRELQFLASGTGWDQHWYSRTLDFSKADRADKDVRESPAGKSKHDAREILFSLPNGLMGGYLANGEGKQAAFAPQQVAEDQREASPDRYYSPTKTVVNFVKCIDCHLESRGLIGFDDNAIKLINPPRLDTGYLVYDHDPKAAARETVRIEEFYRAGLIKKVDLYRTSYEARVKEVTGHDCLAASRNLLRHYDRYTPVYASRMVSPADAALEMGYPIEGARSLWKAASVEFGSNQLGFLAAGQSISRLNWERVVGDALRLDRFSWDYIPVQVKPR